MDYLVKHTIIRFVIAVLMMASSFNGYAADKLNVLASIKPLQLIVDDLAGDWVDSTTLIEGANSPHHFAMRISDRKKIQKADLVVWVGPNLERFLEEVLAKKKTTITFADLEGLTWPAEKHSHHSLTIADPHVWLSLHNVTVFAETLTRRLVELRPDLSAQLATRLVDFKRQITDLDTEAKTTFENLSGAFAVYHDGFGHFTEAYHLNQTAALTLVPEEQISAKRLAQLKAELRQAKCLIADKSELHSGERYAEVLDLPLVTVDMLASDASIASFAAYYRDVIGAFSSCLSGK